MRKLVKVCGMTRGDNIREVEALGVDMMGFIFHPRSPRYATKRPDYLPLACKRVGVFVDSPVSTILERAKDFGLDLIQLHGGETPSFCRELTLASEAQTGDRSGTVAKNVPGIIKVFHVASKDDLEATEPYEGLCRYFLFDTPCPEGGGSGLSFDWSLLEAYDGDTPFILSGGLGPTSIPALKAFSHPLLAGYDLNSRFEVAPGIKNTASLKMFLQEIRKDDLCRQRPFTRLGREA